jgi:glycogen phosphorylase
VTLTKFARRANFVNVTQLPQMLGAVTNSNETRSSIAPSIPDSNSSAQQIRNARRRGIAIAWDRPEEFMEDPRTTAYFSMEIGIESGMPTYSGGLGILAGDTVRSAADLNVSMVAVTLLYRKGYFHQRLDESGWQTEEPAEWVVENFLEEMPQRTCVTIEERTVYIRAWRYKVTGIGGFVVPTYFLDTYLPENSEWDQTLTHSLYGGDEYYRLCQEAILGIGGVRMLRALGYEGLERFHMNEGHASLLTMELARELSGETSSKITRENIEVVRKRCVFTTHTPVPAGHDHFPRDLMVRVLGYVGSEAAAGTLRSVHSGVETGQLHSSIRNEHPS